MKMKKIVAILLSLVVSIPLFACQNQPANSTSAATSQSLNTSSSNELNLYIYETYNVDKYLNEAIALFEKSHPGTKVNLIPFSSMPEEKSTGESKTSINDPNAKAQNDYISRVNTELMTGGGPDILAMDVLPYYKYAESGLLEDITPYMENDSEFNSDDYFQNILDVAKYNGKQYMLPIDYSFDYAVYNKSNLSQAAQDQVKQQNTHTIQELVDIGKDDLASGTNNASKMFALLSGSGLGTSMTNETFLFPWLLNMNYNSFVDFAKKQASFNDGRFAALLNTVQEYTEKNYIYPLDQQNKFMGFEAPSSMFRFLNDTMLYQSLYPDMPVYGSYSSSVGFPSTNESVAGVLASEEKNVTFSYMAQAYAINANSKNKQLAWEFLKLLASVEMQSSQTLIARPINTKALENQSIYTVTGYTYKELGEQKIPANMQSTYDSYVAAQKEYIGAINTYTMRDTVIDYLIQTETASFFDGTKTAEQVASDLQTKVEMYLNE